MTTEACLKCGVRLPESAPTGRPRVYCSTGCRRAAEHELRRLDRQLEDAERQVRYHRQVNANAGARVPSEHSHSEEAWWTKEVERLEARLRELLETEGGRDG